ncbi:dihydrofolate reductase family protein [Streptomyces sp. NPDC059037]|uniref:dihydrofolate reductase family protein n=1 Tax=Streptomyces sp. NPDC059037 TaxID=3346710 RepID=UPI0036961A9C
MRKLTYYVAVTLDGYIAGPDGSFDFFPFEGEVRETIMAEYPETLPVVARGPLGLSDTPNKRFDTILMGRSTYEAGLPIGMTSPYPQLRQYVISSTLTETPSDVTLVADDPVGLVRELKQEDGLDIWLCGGGKLAGALFDEIDELVLKRNPFVIGSGIPLFESPFAVTGFTVSANRSFDSGVNMTTFKRK